MFETELTQFKNQYETASFMVRKILPESITSLFRQEIHSAALIQEIVKFSIHSPRWFSIALKRFPALGLLNASDYFRAYQILSQNKLATRENLACLDNLPSYFLSMLTMTHEKKLLCGSHGQSNVDAILDISEEPFEWQGLFYLDSADLLNQRYFDMTMNSNYPKDMGELLRNIKDLGFISRNNRVVSAPIHCLETHDINSKTLSIFNVQRDSGFFSGEDKQANFEQFIKSQITQNVHRDVHKVIIQIGFELGYNKKDSKGLCNGLTHKWVEAELLEEEAFFFNRIHQRLTSKNIKRKINSVKNGRKWLHKNEPVTEEEREWLEIPSFLGQTNLYQDPQKYTHLYGARLSSINIARTSQLAASDKIMALGGLVSVYSDTRWYADKEAIVAYFSELSKVAEHLDGQKKMVMTIMGMSHLIGLSYHIKNKQWTYMDINTPSFTSSSIEAVVEAILYSYTLVSSPPTPLPYILSVSIVTTNQHAHSFVKPLSDFRKEQPEITKKTRTDVLALIACYAAATNDTDKILELIENQIDFNQVAPVDQESLGFPLIIAAHFGHFELVKLMVENGADVNVVTSENISALNYAAESGGYSIVKYLLEHGAILASRAYSRSDLYSLSEYQNDLCVAQRVNDFLRECHSENTILISPLEIAKIMGHQDIVDLLSSGFSYTMATKIGCFFKTDEALKEPEAPKAIPLIFL